MASFYLEGESVEEGYYPYSNNFIDMTEPAIFIDIVTLLSLSNYISISIFCQLK